MNFGIFRTIANTVQTRSGIRVPAPIEHQQTFHVPSPVRLRSPVKSLPVITPRAPYGTEEITTIIQDQRANLSLKDIIGRILKAVRK